MLSAMRGWNVPVDLLKPATLDLSMSFTMPRR